MDYDPCLLTTQLLTTRSASTRILLGISILLEAAVILRFISYFKQFNAVHRAPSIALPKLGKYIFCALILFLAFTMCGWLVLSPFHYKVCNQADQWRWVPFLVGVYLRQPGTQRHARIQNTGGVTTTNMYLQADQWRWVPFLVGVYLRQPGTQRHARIQNTGGVTTTKKYLQSDQWRWVPFLVGVYLRQPGTQRHAWIQNTGGVTTTKKYLQSDQWRWVPFLVGVYLHQPGTYRHAVI
ncbi:hypothetical protein EMCRGX_G031159 [Ephydatia muelleri]